MSKKPKRKPRPDSEEENKPLTNRDFVLEIKTAWQKSVTSIIETGQLLIEAKDALNHHGDWGAMFDDGKLPFSQRTANRLMAIAENKVLSNPTHVSNLPPSWGTLHILSELPDPVLEDAIVDGTINCEMERYAADALAKTVRSDGHYRWLALRKALNVVLKFSDHWKDKVAEVASEVFEPGVDHTEIEKEKEPVNWERLSSLSEWIANLHEACRKAEANVTEEEKEEQVKKK